MIQTITLTGISGFLAKAIALAALERGWAVRGTVRNPARADEVRATLAAHLRDRAALDRLSFHAADLESDDGWPAAMAGADALVHTASPFPIEEPKYAGQLIRPAVEGTTRALRAAHAAGVRRVVLTSSVIAVIDQTRDTEQDESDWCRVDLETTSAYGQSKTLAERAAWKLSMDLGLSLTTINPSFILGPPLDAHYGASLRLVERLLRGKDPALPDYGMPFCDVRDIAEMHLRALERPNTIGRRYIGSGGSMTLPEMGRILKAAYPERRIPTKRAPNWVIRLIALVDPQVRAVTSRLGRVERVSSAAAERDLGMSFIPAPEALLASADWLVRHGRV